MSITQETLPRIRALLPALEARHAALRGLMSAEGDIESLELELAVADLRTVLDVMVPPEEDSDD